VRPKCFWQINEREMSPNIMKKMVYIRYEKKYRKWMERLGFLLARMS